jgi:hypothetical protein
VKRTSRENNLYFLQKSSSPRHLLYVGAGNAIRFAKSRAASGKVWIQGLQQRRPPKVVIIALANKMARIAWALMTRGQSFRAPTAVAVGYNRRKPFTGCEDKSEVMARPIGPGIERARRALGANSATR